MMTAVLLCALAQVHVTVHLVPDRSREDLAARIANLECRLASAGQLPAQPRAIIDIIEDGQPAQLPANGCYAAPAAVPSTYAPAPMYRRVAPQPQAYVPAIIGQFSQAPANFRMERRGILGRTNLAMEGGPGGMAIEKRGILGQRVYAATAASRPVVCRDQFGNLVPCR